MAILRKLIDDNAADPNLRDILAAALCYLGDVVRSLGRAAEARPAYEQAIALKESLVEEDPDKTEHRYALTCAIWRRGLSLRDLGDPTGAAADIRRALSLCDGMRAVGRELSVRDGLLSRGARGPGRAGRIGRLGGRGGGCGRQGDGMAGPGGCQGYRNTNELRIESALDPLRDRPDFKKLMAELEKNAPPQQEKK